MVKKEEDAAIDVTKDAAAKDAAAKDAVVVSSGKVTRLLPPPAALPSAALPPPGLVPSVPPMLLVPHAGSRAREETPPLLRKRKRGGGGGGGGGSGRSSSSSSGSSGSGSSDGDAGRKTAGTDPILCVLTRAFITSLMNRNEIGVYLSSKELVSFFFFFLSFYLYVEIVLFSLLTILFDCFCFLLPPLLSPLLPCHPILSPFITSDQTHLF